MDIIAAIFETIGATITAFAENMASAFTSITGMFWVEPTGTETVGHLSTLGVFTLITAGISVLIFAFTFIYRLIRRA